jgi:hypothetical protein
VPADATLTTLTAVRLQNLTRQLTSVVCDHGSFILLERRLRPDHELESVLLMCALCDHRSWTTLEEIRNWFGQGRKLGCLRV